MSGPGLMATTDGVVGCRPETTLTGSGIIFWTRGNITTLTEDSIICSESWAICWDTPVIRSCLKEIWNKRLDLQIDNIQDGLVLVAGKFQLVSMPYGVTISTRGDYIDRGRYHFLDKGRYYYLDEGQYNWLGGLGYSFGRPHYQRQYDWVYYQSVGQFATPEPCTIGFLGLGALGVLVLRNKRRIGGAMESGGKALKCSSYLRHKPRVIDKKTTG